MVRLEPDRMRHAALGHHAGEPQFRVSTLFGEGK